MAGQVERWQSLIWNQISGERPGLAGQMDSFLRRDFTNCLDGVPPRICLFGVSAMPISFITMLSVLSQYREVYMFLLTPCSQFFFDIPSPKQERSRGIKSESGHDPGPESGLAFSRTETFNPLLSTLGRTGREFHSCLEDLDYDEPLGDLFRDPVQDHSCLTAPHISMLSMLQSDILNLIAREPGGEAEPVAVSAQDRSISIHACHFSHERGPGS